MRLYVELKMRDFPRNALGDGVVGLMLVYDRPPEGDYITVEKVKEQKCWRCGAYGDAMATTTTDWFCAWCGAHGPLEEQGDEH